MAISSKEGLRPSSPEARSTDTKPRVGEDSARPKKWPADGDGDGGLLGELTDKGVRKQQTGPSIHCWDLHAAGFYSAATSPATTSGLSLLAWPPLQGAQGLPCEEGAPGWPPLESLTLNAEQHVFLHMLLDGNIEEGRDPYILKRAINRGT